MSATQREASALADGLSIHLAALLKWVARNGYSGWDPYDVWDTKLGAWITARNTFPRRLAKLLLARVGELWPTGLRWCLRVAPAVNPKAMGLLASALLRLETLNMAPNALGDEPSYAACFHWLDANCVMSGGGVGWGYPFNWQSRVFIPRGTPTVVNSSIIGDAYWLRYKTQGAGADLARCEEICRFILGGLNRSYSKDGTFCFSYTPIDHLEVHNANLLGAEFLIRIGIETNRQEWVNTGLQAARFSLGQIQEDGTLSYWSNAQSTAVLQQDTYHAGFEIRALHRIAQATDLEEFRTAADSYFAVWRRDYFAADGAPCFQRKSQGVVEVHSLAEALLCASEMHAGKRFTDQEFVNLIGAAFQAGTRALWISEGPGLGYFARIQQRRYGIVIRTDIPFLRWGEAWMAAAMAAALERTQKVAKGEGTVVEKA